MNFISLYNEVLNKKEAIKFLQKYEILHNERICKNNHKMSLCLSEKEDRWRCNKKECRNQIQLKADTWLEGTHLKYNQIIMFIYSWAFEQTSIKYCQRELGIGSIESIVDWNNYLREVCTLKLIKNPIFIGGLHKTVEIDESLFVRRKYNVGHMVNQQWVFGAICNETKECFLLPIINRSEDTLLNIIKKYILPYSTIISDKWKGYNNITNIKDRYYKHITVNHSKNFVDPISGGCTNTIESLWGKAKIRNKKQWGTHKAMLNSYLCEFIWRQKNKNNNPFLEIMKDISKTFPLF